VSSWIGQASLASQQRAEAPRIYRKAAKGTWTPATIGWTGANAG